MLNKFITSVKLYKLLTSQPFFVWNDLLGKTFDQEDENIQFDFPDFIDNPNDLTEYGVSFSQIQLSSFKKVKKKYREFLETKFGTLYELKSKTIDERAKETLECIKKQEHRFILDPTFSYTEGTFEILAIPSLYDTKTKTLYFNKFSGSTKRKDILKMLFDYLVVRKIGFEVNDIRLHIFATKEYKKGEIDFFETQYINTSTTSRSNKSARDAFDFVSLQMYKSGMALKKNGSPYESKTIFEIITDRQIRISKKETFLFYSLDEYVKKIIDAENESVAHYPTQKDATPFGSNSQWNELLNEFAPEYYGYNGKIVSKKHIIEQTPLKELANSSDAVKSFVSNKFPVINDIDLVNSMMSKLKGKVVWYDFEAFSLPFSSLDGVLPYNQVVSQVSVIITDNEKTTSWNNTILDPKNYDLNDFVTLLDVVFKKDHKYVVYNKSYENVRWLEMGRLLRKYDHPKANEFIDKTNDIIDNTIDLADFFIVSGKNNIPLITIPELKMKHSIKLLEKYITNSNVKLDYHITPYQSLDIKQGMMAMETANYRALGLIGDNEWKIKEKQLKEYCENDVKAMIMVYYLIKKILINSNPLEGQWR